ncbi:MAG: CheR family methyltransferase [Planctomycetota bacterium]|jgi:chemotaxis protein methyltransferase CheR
MGNDQECVRFLQWALPKLRFRWQGFRKVRGQVWKRIRRRLHELGLADADAYCGHLQANAQEWGHLDSLCRVTISRFCRDRGVFEQLGSRVLPELGARELRCWSAGCASGEEPYSLSLVWRIRLASRTPLRILATDSDPPLLERAKAAVYGRSSLRELPDAWIARAFVEDQGMFQLRPEFRQGIAFQLQDLRRAMPKERFHLVLCRNLAFTYFEEELQKEVLRGIRSKLLPGGVLVLGAHEHLPAGAVDFEPISPGLFRLL